MRSLHRRYIQSRSVLRSLTLFSSQVFRSTREIITVLPSRSGANGEPIADGVLVNKTPRQILQLPIRKLKEPITHELTVLVPAYNEQERLGASLSELKAFLDRTKIDYRVVVVDDGSWDETAQATLTQGPRFSTLRLPVHRGKGAAVRTGMLSTTGHVIAFTDADLPYKLNSLVEGYECIRRGDCHVVFGARDITGSVIHAPRRLPRRVTSAVFRYFTVMLISRTVIDTQCGLKLFSWAAAREIFSRATIDGFAFDAEVVCLTDRLNIPFLRIPVLLCNERSSTLSIRRHALQMLKDVLTVRYRHRKLNAAMAGLDFATATQPLLRRAA